MAIYVVRRILSSVPILLLAVTAVFFAFQVIPGDPARLYVGSDASEEAVEQARRDLGLDRPVGVQYLSYLARLARADLGRSISTRRPVSVELGSRFVNTVKLSLASIVLAAAGGIALGTIAAVNQGTVWDHAATLLALLGISIPVFWLGLLLMYLLSVQWQLLPSAGNDTWLHYFMPTVSLATFSLAFIARMTRSSLLEVIRQDYVRTARAKGVPDSMVVLGHALRNALLPVTIVVGLRFGYMLGGAVVTEEVFAWPGLGRLLVTAVGQRDIPVIQGVLLVFAASFVLVNMAVDLVYGFLDPQIHYR
ncbi:MAG: ABC transporter permease [Armatimonadota bacterium]|nr:ABC transporter permease [Armatimonadota bacterium]